MDSQEILNVLDTKVVGHTEFKKALIALVTRSSLRHFQKYIKGLAQDDMLTPMKILVKGASGTGKTHTVECLRNYLDFPFLILDATQINPAGSSGKNKPEDIEQMIYAEANRCFKESPTKYLTQAGAVDRLVVFVDEFDKLATSFESSGKWNKHVQSNLLTLIDNKHEFSGVSWIFAGAFVDLDKNKTDKKKRIGFDKYSDDDNNDVMLDEELVKAGMIPEIVGRLSYIVELDKFTKDDFVMLMKTRILPKKYKDLSAYGVYNKNMTKKEIEKIATNALKSGQGVRYLHREVDRHFLELEFNAGINYTKYNN